MPNPYLSEFKVRLPLQLKEQLQTAAKARRLSTHGKSSLNREIVDRLQLSFDPDAAVLLAERLRPLLKGIEEQEQHRLLELAADMIQILRRRPRKRSP